MLQFDITTEDKFLPPPAAQNLAGAPAPPAACRRAVGLFGRAPLWLYGAYARWLLAAGAESLASWDGRTKGFVEVYGSSRRQTAG